MFIGKKYAIVVGETNNHRIDLGKLRRGCEMNALKTNTNWMLWGVATAGIITLLFMCGLIVYILHGQTQGLFGDNEPPLTAPTFDATLVQNEPDTSPSVFAPTVTSRPTDQIPPTATAKQPLTPKVTAAPIATATIPPNGSITAFRIDTPFVVDGDLNGWGNIPSYQSAFQVFSISDWDDTADLDGYWRLAWDDDNLYVGVVVVDDIHVQDATGDKSYKGDGLEIQLNTILDEDDDPLGQLSVDDYQIELSPGNFVDNPPAAWRYRGQTSGAMESEPNDSITISSQPTDEGYVLEASIPWSDLNVTPNSGQLLGIALNINDNDTPDSLRQEVMKSHISTRRFSNPESWGTLILGKQ